MTATINEGDLDTDWLDLLDFDEAVACDIEECDDKAEWKVVLSCCGHVWLMCQEHFDDNLETFARKDVYAIVCIFCKTQTEPAHKIVLSAERI